MNSEQKFAWAIVIGGILGLVGFLVAWPFVGPMKATAAFGITGLSALIVPAWVLYRVITVALGLQKGPIFQKILTDERDRYIFKRATFAGAMVAFGVYTAGPIVARFVAVKWFHQEQVDADLSSLMTFLGVSTFFIVQSVTLLILYARQSGTEDA